MLLCLLIRMRLQLHIFISIYKYESFCNTIIIKTFNNINTILQIIYKMYNYIFYCHIIYFDTVLNIFILFGILLFYKKG